jgi:hypothetical protein
MTNTLAAKAKYKKKSKTSRKTEVLLSGVHRVKRNPQKKHDSEKIKRGRDEVTHVSGPSVKRSNVVLERRL